MRLETRFTYRRGIVCRLPQAVTVAKDERGVLIVLVDRALRLVVRVVVGKNAARLHARGRLEGFGLGVERARVHGGRDQGGDWGWKVGRVLGLYNQVTGRIQMKLLGHGVVT